MLLNMLKKTSLKEKFCFGVTVSKTKLQCSNRFARFELIFSFPGIVLVCYRSIICIFVPIKTKSGNNFTAAIDLKCLPQLMKLFLARYFY